MSARKTKVTLVIDGELNRRLDYQAARDGKGHDRSSIVSGLVEAHIKLPDAVDAILTCPVEAKPSGRSATRDDNRGKTTFYLPHETARRLALHMTWTGEDRSAAVERLIRAHVPVWEVYDSAKFRKPTLRTNRSDPAGDVNLDVAAVA
jgi:hypothetical protein